MSSWMASLSMCIPSFRVEKGRTDVRICPDDIRRATPDEEDIGVDADISIDLGIPLDADDVELGDTCQGAELPSAPASCSRFGFIPLAMQCSSAAGESVSCECSDLARAPLRRRPVDAHCEIVLLLRISPSLPDSVFLIPSDILCSYSLLELLRSPVASVAVAFRVELGDRDADAVARECDAELDTPETDADPTILLHMRDRLPLRLVFSDTLAIKDRSNVENARTATAGKPNDILQGGSGRAFYLLSRNPVSREHNY
jgi:hypothetical protein